MKRFVLAFALIVGLLTSASTLQAQVNMSRYITLTVKNGAAIKLNFKAAAAGTPVRIVSGSTDTTVTVGANWYNSSYPSTYTVTAADSTMTVYGNITAFRCNNNGANITAIDLSHNTQLKWLDCVDNNLTSLDLSHNTQLKWLDCSVNNLTSLDVSKNTQLTRLGSSSNQLTIIDLSHNTQLTSLSCYRNYLTSLNVSNTQLELLYCYSNNFSTQALDDIYCALPVRSASDNAEIVPVESASAPNHATVLATNAQNATAKNWKVLYVEDNADVPTTGKHKCSATDIVEASAEPALTLYPNPVADMLYLSATARTIRVYNIYGTEVAHATDTDRVEVSHLPAGIYTVRADGTVAKMVKR